jgi:hypothetical protein
LQSNHEGININSPNENTSDSTVNDLPGRRGSDKNRADYRAAVVDSSIVSIFTKLYCHPYWLLRDQQQPAMQLTSNPLNSYAGAVPASVFANALLLNIQLQTTSRIKFSLATIASFMLSVAESATLETYFKNDISVPSEQLYGMLTVARLLQTALMAGYFYQREKKNQAEPPVPTIVNIPVKFFLGVATFIYGLLLTDKNHLGLPEELHTATRFAVPMLGYGAVMAGFQSLFYGNKVRTGFSFSNGVSEGLAYVVCVLYLCPKLPLVPASVVSTAFTTSFLYMGSTACYKLFLEQEDNRAHPEPKVNSPEADPELGEVNLLNGYDPFLPGPLKEECGDGGQEQGPACSSPLKIRATS